jgi:hypothetical protein
MIVTYGLAFTVIPYQVAFLYGHRDEKSVLSKITKAVGESMTAFLLIFSLSKRRRPQMSFV